MRVAFLGLGIMGRSMAANLVKAGHEVAVWNRTPGKQVEGARVAATPAEAATGAEVVWMCVSDTQAVEQVLFGAEGVQNSLTSGMTVVDSSTISPSATQDFAQRLRSRGVDYVDAPVTGSKIGAENASLIFIVGGDEAVIERVKPVGNIGRQMERGLQLDRDHRYGEIADQQMRTLTHISAVTLLGKEAGQPYTPTKGQAAKLVMNLQIALIFEGFAEALTLATKLGVNTEALISVVQASMIRSGVVDYKAPFILKRDFSPNFPLRLMHKDIHLALDAAREARVKLPGLETVEEVYDLASEEGQRDMDYAATLTLLEKWAGVEVKGNSQ